MGFVLRLICAPFVGLLIGILGTIGFVLSSRREKEQEEDPEPIERRVRVEEDENERRERRWTWDLNHSGYRQLINRVASANELDTAARLPSRR